VPNLGGAELLLLLLVMVVVTPIMLFAAIFFGVRLGTRQKDPGRRT
jgi:hypothetical protein